MQTWFHAKLNQKTMTVSIGYNFADYKVKIRNGRRSENLREHVLVQGLLTLGTLLCSEQLKSMYILTNTDWI